MKCRSLLLLFSFPFLTAPLASAFELTALAGANYAAPTEQLNGSDYHWTGDAAFVYGVLIDLPLFTPSFSIESGALFQNQKSERQLNATLTETTKNIEVPIALRYCFDENISLGVGWYFGFQNNSVITINGAGNTTTSSLAGISRNSLDSGLVADLRATYPLLPEVALVADVRYQHGFANLSTAAGDVYNTRSLQVLAGLKVEF